MERRGGAASPPGVGRTRALNTLQRFSRLRRARPCDRRAMPDFAYASSLSLHHTELLDAESVTSPSVPPPMPVTDLEEVVERRGSCCFSV